MTYNYWLDTNGILHDAGVGIAQHNEWARDYLLSEGLSLKDIVD